MIVVAVNDEDENEDEDEQEGEEKDYKSIKTYSIPLQQRNFKSFSLSLNLNSAEQHTQKVVSNNNRLYLFSYFMLRTQLAHEETQQRGKEI